MPLVALFLPLISFFLIILFGRFLGLKGSIFVSVLNLGLSLSFSIILLYDIIHTGDIKFYSFMRWFDSGLFTFNWSFIFDQLTIIMFFVVTFVSFLVHLYSIEYMRGDPHHSRFMAYLSLFTFFMLILVSAGNLIQIFLGWEGVGIASYLLINFWFTRLQANKAALKAIVVNRVGDFFLGMAIVLIFYVFKTLDFPLIFTLAHHYHNFFIPILNFEINLLDLIALFIFFGAVGKSAQLGLHTWLPDAMEGPTPVSALIHAATMVTAGVFVIIRMSPILEYSTITLTIIVIFGSLTALFGATVAVFQNDIKKIIAYSTCSQLGYMIFCCGLSSYNVAFFHLFNHAFFKALLFLSAGSVIHALSDDQDLRKMGGLAGLLPITYLMFFIGSFSLAGFPFLTGFYSKDLILELSFSEFSNVSLFAYVIGTLSAFFTAFYSIRLLYLAFFVQPNSAKSIMTKVHEPSIIMLTSLLSLCIGTIWFGYIFKDLFVGLGSSFWSNSIFVSFNTLPLTDSEFLPAYIKMFPVLFSLTGMILSYFFVLYFYSFDFKLILIERFLNKKWYFDQVYNAIIVTEVYKQGRVGFSVVDRGFIEVFGPDGFLRLLRKVWFSLSKFLQTGYVFHYLHLMLSGVVIIIFSLIFFESLFFTVNLLMVITILVYILII